MDKEKILLALLPFWEPQIPPLGISSLKTFLEKNDYTVKTVDANIVEAFSEYRRHYFTALAAVIPADKQGNFNNIGHDVLRNHMMARIHYSPQKEDEYLHLVKILVSKTFFVSLTHRQVRGLDIVLENFYRLLETYFLKLLEEEKPSVLGLSVYRGNLAPSMFAFQLTRQHQPEIRTVMGGAVFAGELAVGSDNLDYFLETTPYIDKVIIGEGEILFLKYLKGELPESQRLYTLEDIGGKTLDIKNSSLPDFSDLHLDFYPNLAAYTSRSCPFQCSFCTETVFWGNYRKKSPRQIVEELTALYDKYHRQLFLMCDSLLNPIISELSHQLIEAGLSLYFDGYLRADPQACCIDNAWLWRRAGFYRARLGIESGSPHVLQLMGKNISNQHIKNTLANLAEAGIKTTTYWVIGHPGEREEDFQQTLDILEELGDDIYEAWCSPFNYYVSGQVKSDQWKKKSSLLYPQWAKDKLIVQTRTLDGNPSREETYQRVNRFVRHCAKLGIPNPYSMIEFHKADERWKRLHKNAVPSLVEFENKEIRIDEHKRIKKQVAAQQKLDKNINFDF